MQSIDFTDTVNQLKKKIEHSAHRKCLAYAHCPIQVYVVIYYLLEHFSYIHFVDRGFCCTHSKFTSLLPFSLAFRSVWIWASNRLACWKRAHTKLVSLSLYNSGVTLHFFFLVLLVWVVYRLDNSLEVDVLSSGESHFLLYSTICSYFISWAFYLTLVLLRLLLLFFFRCLISFVLHICAG